jgi:hypothetical protein
LRHGEEVRIDETVRNSYANPCGFVQAPRGTARTSLRGPFGLGTGAKRSRAFTAINRSQPTRLSDVNPGKIHMTLPVRFRKIQQRLRFSFRTTAVSPTANIEAAAGYRYTRPMRTIVDAITVGELDRSTITQAVRQAFERDLCRAGASQRPGAGHFFFPLC